MLTVSGALVGIALPAGVAAVLLLVRLAGARAGMAAFALGSAYLAGHIGLRGWRGWAPRESTDWIAACAAAGLLVGVAGLTRRGPPVMRVALRWALAGAAAWFVAGRSLARRGELEWVLGEMALVAAGGALAWSLLESRRYAGGERPSVSSVLLPLTAVGCAALAVGLSGSVLLAQLTGALAAALGGALLATWLRRAPALLPGAAAVIALTLLALLLAATVHAKLPLAAALLLALAAIVPPPAADASSGVRGALPALSLCALFGGAAVAIAFQASPPLEG